MMTGMISLAAPGVLFLPPISDSCFCVVGAEFPGASIVGYGRRARRVRFSCRAVATAGTVGMYNNIWTDGILGHLGLEKKAQKLSDLNGWSIGNPKAKRRAHGVLSGLGFRYM